MIALLVTHTHTHTHTYTHTIDITKPHTILLHDEFEDKRFGVNVKYRSGTCVHESKVACVKCNLVIIDKLNLTITLMLAERTYVQ